MTDPLNSQQVTQKWQTRLTEWLPGFLTEHPVLQHFHNSVSVILHGSLTLGIDDPFTDVDLWCLLPEDQLKALDDLSNTRFFSFELDGKPGHINANSAVDFERSIRECNMDIIYQLRRGAIIQDVDGMAAKCQSMAMTPMSPSVRRTLFMNHYIEMRSEHRACDTPIERGHAPALLFFLPKVLAHALRAAMVLDSEPFPYDKWLFQVARSSPTGRLIAPSVDRILDLLAAGHLRTPGPEPEHPIGCELRVIRNILIESARAGGIDEPWLIRWWPCMDEARKATQAMRWTESEEADTGRIPDEVVESAS